MRGVPARCEARRTTPSVKHDEEIDKPSMRLRGSFLPVSGCRRRNCKSRRKHSVRSIALDVSSIAPDPLATALAFLANAIDLPFLVSDVASVEGECLSRASDFFSATIDPCSISIDFRPFTSDHVVSGLDCLSIRLGFLCWVGRR